MAGGGKGGSTTSKVEIPKYIEDASRANLARADEIAKIGYVPYSGPDVAAFTPMQQAAFQGTSDTASAFGLATPASDVMGGMPAPTQFAGGVRGYSSAPIYEQALAELQSSRPAQYAALTAPFIDPVTGGQPSAPFGRPLVQAPAGAASSVYSGGDDGGDNGMSYGGQQSGFSSTYQGPSMSGAAGYGAGGYSGLSDMFDGGGPGRSGGAYQGGGMISGVGNAVTGGGPDGGGAGGSDKILCCAYYNLGYLPREIWRLDQRYGVWLLRNDPELMRGYHVWAAPLAELVQEETPGAKVVRAIMWPIVNAWAQEMAHKQQPDKHKANMFGKFITAIGEPFSRICGKLKSRSIEGAF